MLCWESVMKREILLRKLIKRGFTFCDDTLEWHKAVEK
jgi:hypothetical protein